MIPKVKYRELIILTQNQMNESSVHFTPIFGDLFQLSNHDFYYFILFLIIL